MEFEGIEGEEAGDIASKHFGKLTQMKFGGGVQGLSILPAKRVFVSVVGWSFMRGTTKKPKKNNKK